MAPTKERPATKTIATNREARHEYFVLEALETGVELKGTEVKSLRAGGVNLKDSWVDIEDGELLVKTYLLEDGLYVDVIDNGSGIPAEICRTLLTDETRVRSKGSGIGLRNVHQRIQLTYGKDYGLTILSEPDVGTTVRIRLPKVPFDTPDTTKEVTGR